MDQSGFPTNVPSDSDVERIKARIRRQCFTLFDGHRLITRMFLIGTVCGLAGGLWKFVSTLLAYNTAVPNSALPIASILESAVAFLIARVIIGALGGSFLGMLIVGLFSFFRPVYVALRYSPEEFERQYADKPRPKH